MELKDNQVVLSFFYEHEAREFFRAIKNDARLIVIYDQGSGEIESPVVIDAYHATEE